MKTNIRDEYLAAVHSAYFHTVIGSVLPFLIASILLTITVKFKAIIHFLDKGDFCIYSAGLFSTSIYLFNENRPSINKKLDRWLYNCLYYLLMFAALIYGSIYLLDNLDLQITDVVNSWTVRVFSIVLFVLSLTAVYRSLLIQKKDSFPEIDVRKKNKDNVDQILKELD